MKKILSFTMALAMLGTALTGCGSKDAAAQTPAENTQQTAPVQQEQSQTEKALALINTFATGDTDTAHSLLADGYIQHNLAYGTGADAFIGSVEYLASADVKTTVNNIRAFEDGDKVFFPGRAESLRSHPDGRHDGGHGSGQDRGKPRAGQEFPL